MSTSANTTNCSTASATSCHTMFEGMYYFPNAITAVEEQQLLEAVDRGFDTSNQELTLEMIKDVWKDVVEFDRRTQQWGAWRFNKTINGIDKQTNPKRVILPPLVQDLIARFQHSRMLNPKQNYNQLIINEYFAGQGIAPHIDHSMFGCEIASLSLQSAVVMTFRDIKTNETFDLLLEPRSLLVMSGRSRWHVTHEIKKRMTDKINGKIVKRDRRVSITMRNY